MAHQPWLPATWDRQADVVVVGFGAAGAATAITAYDAGAKVILLDKAAQGHEGGNTRVGRARAISTRHRSSKPSPISTRCMGPTAFRTPWCGYGRRK
jgi:glycine/D-amino acid oxidase-like deaminating enzyme